MRDIRDYSAYTMLSDKAAERAKRRELEKDLEEQRAARLRADWEKREFERLQREVLGECAESEKVAAPEPEPVAEPVVAAPEPVADVKKPRLVVEPVKFKYCSKCGRFLSVDHFSRCSQSKTGYYSSCRLCQSNHTRKKQNKKLLESEDEMRPVHRWNDVDQNVPEGYRRCRKCGEVKPMQNFVKHPNCSNGYSYMCKACYTEGARLRYHKRKALKELKEHEKQQGI